MNKIQFLLSLVILIPIFAACGIYCVRNNLSFLTKFSTFLSLIMIVNLLNLSYNYDGNLNAISVINIIRNLDIGFSITNISLLMALIVSFIWFIITIYSDKYFALSHDKRFFAFTLFSTILIAIITLIIFSKNLISLFLFYQLLIFTLFFFNSYFLKDKDLGASNLFSLSMLASAFFMFLATILVYKITRTTEFANFGVFNSVLSYRKYFVLLALLLLSIGSIAFIPAHLFYKRLFNLSAPIIIMVFVMSFGLVSLVILLKLILNIFGSEYLTQRGNRINLNYVLNLIIGANLLVSGALILLQNNIKRILLFLFFNQLIFAFFLFLALNQSIKQFIITIIAFILSQTLLFLCLGNINLYLTQCKEKILDGIFHKLKITSCLLFFALLSLIGIIPTVGFIEKYLVIKYYFKNGFDISFLVIFANIILVGIAAIRIVQPMIAKDRNQNDHDIKLAQKIDRNFSLIFPALVLACVLFASFVFSSKIIAYADRLTKIILL